MSGRPDPDPEQLLRQARGGDGEALGRLLELYRNYLAVLARVEIGRQLQGKANDSDVIQDTFLEAYRHFGQFRGTTEAELTAWLQQILAGRLGRLVRRYFGTRRRDLRREQELALHIQESSQALDGGLVARGSSPSQQAERREQAVLLADALQRLPEHYREVIILSHLEGLPFPEVARRMGRSLNSVKNLWARALGRLRRSMGADP
jgi:RNA polymerase sigma-70 factor (ECF subfamily)